MYHNTTICGLTFTTEANIYGNTYNQLLSATKHILYQLKHSRLAPQLTIGCMEVVLELAGDRTTWGYYIVDHKTQHMLWLEPSILKLDCLDAQSYFLHASEWLKLITCTITSVI